VKSDAFFELF